MEKSLNKEYCEYFGIDYLLMTNITNIEHGSIIKKTETMHSCFGLTKHERIVKFYDYTILWKLGEKTFRANFPPIIKKIKEGRDTRYILDEQKMKEQVLKVIKENHERT